MTVCGTFAFTQEDPIALGGGKNLYGLAGGDPVNNSDPFGLCPPRDDNKADCPAEKDEAASRQGGSRTALQRVGDFAAGFGDFVTFGATKVARGTLLDCADCVDDKSGVYTAGEISAGVVGALEGGLGVARAAGWTSRIALHEAHHAFPVIGEAAHVQVNIWQIGTKGSGFTLLRIPLPWR